MAKLIVSILAHFVNHYQHIRCIDSIYYLYRLIFLFKSPQCHRYKLFLMVLLATCSVLMGRLGNEN